MKKTITTLTLVATSTTALQLKHSDDINSENWKTTNNDGPHTLIENIKRQQADDFHNESLSMNNTIQRFQLMSDAERDKISDYDRDLVLAITARDGAEFDWNQAKQELVTKTGDKEKAEKDLANEESRKAKMKDEFAADFEELQRALSSCEGAINQMDTMKENNPGGHAQVMPLLTNLKTTVRGKITVATAQKTTDMKDAKDEITRLKGEIETLDGEIETLQTRIKTKYTAYLEQKSTSDIKEHDKKLSEDVKKKIDAEIGEFISERSTLTTDFNSQQTTLTNAIACLAGDATKCGKKLSDSDQEYFDNLNKENQARAGNVAGAGLGSN